MDKLTEGKQQAANKAYVDGFFGKPKTDPMYSASGVGVGPALAAMYNKGASDRSGRKTPSLPHPELAGAFDTFKASDTAGKPSRLDVNPVPLATGPAPRPGGRHRKTKKGKKAKRRQTKKKAYSRRR